MITKATLWLDSRDQATQVFYPNTLWSFPDVHEQTTHTKKNMEYAPAVEGVEALPVRL